MQKSQHVALRWRNGFHRDAPTPSPCNASRLKGMATLIAFLVGVLVGLVLAPLLVFLFIGLVYN